VFTLAVAQRLPGQPDAIQAAEQLAELSPILKIKIGKGGPNQPLDRPPIKIGDTIVF
jgi:hypothetical protein